MNSTTIPMISTLPQESLLTRGGYASVFIDYENIYYYLFNAEIDDPEEAVIHVLREIRKWLPEKRGEQCIAMEAYADFDRVNIELGPLYLMGVETHNVLGTEHKNAADMRLCIDALSLLYTRPAINTFVFVAGDRDYIPLIQHLKKQAKNVLVVAFRGSLSGDLLVNVGDENFIDAQEMVTDSVRKQLEAARHRQAIQAKLKIPSSATTGKPAILRRDPSYKMHEAKFENERPIDDENARICLQVLLEDFGHHKEVFLKPYLKRLNDALSWLANFQRKALIEDLIDRGAIAIETRKRDDVPPEFQDYSVAIINWNHPTVQELNPGM